MSSDKGRDIVHLCVLLVVLFFVGKTVSMTTTDIAEDQDSQKDQDRYFRVPKSK